MKKLPPVAPIRAKGPLGVCQLPRMWSKVLLDAKGLLAPGYATIGDGFDKVVVEGLGLDRAEVLSYLTSELPTYPAFEAWIVAKLGAPPTPATIAAVNSRILGAEISATRRAEIFAAAGLSDDGSYTRVAEVDEIDDWAEFHRYLTRG